MSPSPASLVFVLDDDAPQLPPGLVPDPLEQPAQVRDLGRGTLQVKVQKHGDGEQLYEVKRSSIFFYLSLSSLDGITRRDLTLSTKIASAVQWNRTRSRRPPLDRQISSAQLFILVVACLPNPPSSLFRWI
jgi:hypothetical protein